MPIGRPGSSRGCRAPRAAPRARDRGAPVRLIATALFIWLLRALSKLSTAAAGWPAHAFFERNRGPKRPCSSASLDFHNLYNIKYKYKEEYGAAPASCLLAISSRIRSDTANE